MVLTLSTTNSLSQFRSSCCFSALFKAQKLWQNSLQIYCKDWRSRSWDTFLGFVSIILCKTTLASTFSSRWKYKITVPLCFDPKQFSFISLSFLGRSLHLNWTMLNYAHFFTLQSEMLYASVTLWLSAATIAALRCSTKLLMHNKITLSTKIVVCVQVKLI